MMSTSHKPWRTRSLIVAVLAAVATAGLTGVAPSRALADHEPNFISKVSPPPGSVLYTTSPTFTWREQRHSDSYHIVVKCVWGYYCNPGEYYVDTSTSSTSYTADYLPPYGWYSWRVSGENAWGEGPRGEWWDFCLYC